MQTHRSPGIDWQDEAAPKARAGDRTGVPAFLGLVSRKPAFREWYRLRNAAQFDERFSVPPGGRMASAVQSFFANGGAECLIVPVDAAGRDDLISALRTLERAQGIDLLCAPDLMPNGGGSSDEVIERQALLVAHATAMGDMPLAFRWYSAPMQRTRPCTTRGWASYGSPGHSSNGRRPAAA
jgi:hypothetical protein